MFGKKLYIQVMTTYAPAWGFGGPLRIMYDYALWMAEEMEVKVFTCNLNHDFKEFEPSSIEIFPFEIKRYKIFFKQFAKKNWNFISPILLFQLLLEIKKSKKKIILHICEFRGFIPLYIIIIKKLFGTKVLLIHSAFGMLHDKESVFRHVYDRFFLKLFLQSIDTCLVQNDHEENEYHKYLKKNTLKYYPSIKLFPLHISNTWIEENFFILGSKNKEIVKLLRRKYSLKEEIKIFIFLGRLHKEKGILRVIEVFLNYLKISKLDCQLLIIGRDDGHKTNIEKYILENQAEKRIKIVTDVYDHRFEYYFLSDIFMGFPTIYEETMLASLEALSCGTPVIVSNEASIPFLVNNRSGFVIEYSIQNAIEAINSIIEKLDYFQINALILANNMFLSKTAKEKFQTFFEQLNN